MGVRSTRPGHRGQAALLGLGPGPPGLSWVQSLFGAQGTSGLVLTAAASPENEAHGPGTCSGLREPEWGALA